MALQMQNPLSGERRLFAGLDNVKPSLSRTQPVEIVAARSQMDRDPILPMQAIEPAPFGSAASACGSLRTAGIRPRTQELARIDRLLAAAQLEMELRLADPAGIADLRDHLAALDRVAALDRAARRDGRKPKSGRSDA